MAIIGIGVGVPFRRNNDRWSSYWTPQYQAVLDARATQPSNEDKLIQAKMMKRLVYGGYINKAEFIDIFAVDNGGQNINYANPGTFDPAPVNSPTFTAYEGYKGATTGTKYVRLNFNPAANGTKISQNNITVIIGIGDVVDEDKREFGGYDGTSFLVMQGNRGGNSLYQANSAVWSTVANPNGRGHLAMARNSATVVHRGPDGALANENKNSNGLVNVELYACGHNQNGTATPSNKTVRYVMVLSYLEDYEIRDVISIMEDYLRNYGKSILGHTKAYPIYGTKQLLTIPTSVVGNDETIHPSVLDIGAAFNGYRYWMVNSAYPAPPGTADWIDVFVSSDGITWSVPPGATNPVLPLGDKYNDATLYFEAGTLYLFYRSINNAGSKSTINVIKTTDGINWNSTTPTIVFNAALTNEIALTPSIIKEGESYYMYYVTNTPSANTRARAVSATIEGTYVLDSALVLDAVIGFNHYQVHLFGEKFYMVTGSGTFGICIGDSDDGVHFAIQGLYYSAPVVFNTTVGENQATTMFYKPSLMYVGSRLLLYCSLHGPVLSLTEVQEIKLV